MVLFIRDMIPEDISFVSEGFCFDFKKFYTKINSIVIEKIWNDYKKNENSKIMKNIITINKDINTEFYSINRKCRNNAHYSYIANISIEEYKVLERNQGYYLNNVLKVFNSYILINFNLSYKIYLWLSKIQYWSQK